MASGNNANANVVAFPDLAPKGSRSSGGKRALMGPEIGTLDLVRLRSATVCLLLVKAREMSSI